METHRRPCPAGGSAGRCSAACSSLRHRSTVPWGQSLQALPWTSEEHGERVWRRHQPKQSCKAWASPPGLHLAGLGDLGWEQPARHGSANQSGVLGSILQRPVPTTVPAGKDGALCWTPLTGQLRPWPCRSSPLGCGVAGTICPHDAVAKAEHRFLPLLLLQKGDGGRRAPVCTSLGCSRTEGSL